MRRMVVLVLTVLAESVGATYGASLLAFVVTFGLGFFVGPRLVDQILLSPTFLAPIAAGVVLSFLRRNHLSNTSSFAWIVPAVLFFRACLEVVKSPYATSSETWNTLVGADCGASECLYQLFFTLPLVCALSYSVSSAFMKTIVRREARPLERIL
jgi:hypothetical protein